MWYCLFLLLLYISTFLCAAPDVQRGETAVDYCSIKSCGEKEHVMCRFKEDKLGESCVNFQEGKAFTEAEKKEILKAHNEFRSAVAIGAMQQVPPNGQMLPGAEDIHEVYWDEELEKFAQRWAMQCQAYTKDSCRNTAEFSNVGQLMFQKKWDPTSPLSFHVNMAYLQAGAASTIMPLSTTLAENIQYREQIIVAQLVWANVDKLGCARVVFDNDPTTRPWRSLPKHRRKKNPRGRREVEPTEVVVCNYNDGGDMKGVVYKIGTYCTYCFCSSDYLGLCAGAQGKMVPMIPWMIVFCLVWSM